MVGSERRLGVVEVVSLACLAMVLYRPVSNNNVLVPVLGLLGATSAFLVLRHRSALHPLLIPVVLLQAAFGVYGTSVGVLRGAPGASAGVLVYLAAPVLWWVWACAHDAAMLARTFRVVVYVTLGLSSAIILYTSAQRGLIPAVVPSSLLEAQGAGFRTQGLSYTQIRFYGLSTLAAAGPVCLAIAVLPRHRLLSAPRVAMVAGLLALLACLQAGRRSQVLAMVVAPVLLVIGRRVFRIERTRVMQARNVAIGYVLAVVVSVAFMFDFVSPRVFVEAVNGVVDVVTAADSAGVDDQVRIEQVRQLTDGWMERPVTGNGVGAVLPDYARDPQRPWNFELQYLLLLFQTGAIGVAMLAGVAALLARATRSARERAPELSQLMLVAGIGAASMLVVNASNPYLQAPGHQWPLYLFAATVNAGLLVARRLDDGLDDQGDEVEVRLVAAPVG